MSAETAQSRGVAYPYPEEALHGRLARYLILNEDCVAVVLRNGLQVLSTPGPHRILSIWEILLGRPVPPIWLLHRGTITLHPVINRLLSYDKQLMEADLLVLARLNDPHRFWQTQGTGRPTISQRELERSLACELRRVLDTQVRQFTAQVLLHHPEPVQQLQRTITPSLRAILQGWGMELQGVVHLGFRSARNVVAIEQETQAIRRAIANVRAQAEIERMDLEQMLEHARQEMKLELSEADQAEVSTLAQQTGDPAAAWQQALEARLERLEQLVQDKLDDLAEVRSASPSLLPYDPVEERLSNLVTRLRAVAALIALVTTGGTIFFPHLFQDDTTWRLTGAVSGALVALLALVSSWIVHRRLHRHRRERSQRLSQAQEAAERAAQIEREQGIRRYLEQRLRQIGSNCQQAWKRIYQHNIELAGRVRTCCCQRYQRLADRVHQMGEQVAGQLQAPALSLDALIQLLAHTQGVLDQAQSMVHLSEQLYQAAVDNNQEAVHQLCQQLEKGCLDIENRFAERDRFLYTSDSLRQTR